MRSSLILGIALLLTIAFTSTVQARKRDCSCGNLGPGTNPCKCGEVVVKAARLEKPLYYASPEAINEAAIAREMAQKFTAGTVASGKAAVSSCGSHNRIYGTSSTGSSSSSSSSSRSGSSSSIASSTSAAKGIFGGLIGTWPISGKLTSGSSGCGCGKKSGGSLEIQDLLVPETQGKVVPSFEPIGDLCYPNKNDVEVITTKVTPAYPKLKCCSTPYNVCVKVLNGQIDEAGLKKLGSLTTYNGNAVNALGLLDGSSESSSLSNFGYTSSNAASTVGGYSGGYGSSSLNSFGGYGSGVTGNLGGYSEASGSGSVGGYGLGGISNFGGYSGSSSSGRVGGHGLSGISNFGGYSGSSSSNNFGGYGSSDSSSWSVGYSAPFGRAHDLTNYHDGYGPYNSFGTYGTSSNAEVIKELSETGSNYRNNFDDDNDAPESYSYPRLPADPVSLTLAYKNLFPQTVFHNKRFVPEDKLAFGHRTVPTELLPKEDGPDIPEEKLQIVDKPIVELKPITSISNNIAVYNEQEEARLAELEVIERERINQEEIAEQPQGNFITYGDLGYAPVDPRLVGRLSRPRTSTAASIIDTDDGRCGPVGPPIPGFVPGSIIIDHQVKTESEIEDTQRDTEEYAPRYLEEGSDEEENLDEQTSGIYARLKKVSQKYGSPTCPH